MIRGEGTERGGGEEKGGGVDSYIAGQHRQSRGWPWVGSVGILVIGLEKCNLWGKKISLLKI